MEEQKIKDLIKGWYENKAKRESDPFFKFLCLWICFNAWISYKSNKTTDRDMINWLKNETEKSSDIILEYEHAKKTDSFRKNLGSIVLFSPIKDSIGSRDSISVSGVDDMTNVIEAIYRIRCNLFHGGKSQNDSRDIKLVKCASIILEKWVGNLVVSWRSKI